MLKQKGLQVIGVIKKVLQVGFALGPDQRIGILALGQEQESSLTPIDHQRQHSGQRSAGGLATGLVTIEAEHHFQHKGTYGDGPRRRGGVGGSH